MRSWQPNSLVLGTEHLPCQWKMLWLNYLGNDMYPGLRICAPPSP